jgi:putative addiction module component (TIGR02574 family)
MDAGVGVDPSPVSLWHNHLMAIPAIDLDKLSTDERLELIERVWDSLSNRPEAIPLTNQQRLDLDDCLDELERNGVPPSHASSYIATLGDPFSDASPTVCIFV